MAARRVGRRTGAVRWVCIGGPTKQGTPLAHDTAEEFRRMITL